jgi:uncharacterized membrane protein
MFTCSCQNIDFSPTILYDIYGYDCNHITSGVVVKIYAWGFLLNVIVDHFDILTFIFFLSCIYINIFVSIHSNKYKFKFIKKIYNLEWME